ncbi:hypothetical protein SNE40_003791 [Patella caerulea]|uniref:PiggyBac transposable element-derived protein domain-containing protein n=1 Tax=Patella caerulea TaxID=87958 RepID=A0AAN8KEW1_PATCE
METPYQYIQKLFDGGLIDMVVHETNLYSTQTTGKSINTNNAEIKTFIGIFVLMGVMQVPAYRDYWSNGCRISSVADHMTMRRFEQLRRYIHFCNNDTLDNADKFTKVRPLLEHIRTNLQTIEQEGGVLY